jgi:hypothetical protein
MMFSTSFVGESTVWITLRNSPHAFGLSLVGYMNFVVHVL